MGIGKGCIFAPAFETRAEEFETNGKRDSVCQTWTEVHGDTGMSQGWPLGANTGKRSQFNKFLQ